MTLPLPPGRTRVVEHAPGVSFVEVTTGLAYEDGYRIEVRWSEEDEAWLAVLTGCASMDPAFGCGDTREHALLDLACCLASLCEAIAEPPAP